MTISFDAFVPTFPPDLVKIAKFNASYVPFNTLNKVFTSLNTKFNISTSYVSKVNSVSILNHNIRSIFYALALLHTGYPSGTPNQTQISFEQLTERVYLTGILHDLGLSRDGVIESHPAHAMTFELFGGFLIYEHLLGLNSTHHTNQTFSPEVVGDVVQSTVLHTTSSFTSGNSSATGSLINLCTSFDVLGWDALGPGSFHSWFNQQTINEIEAAYPRLNSPEEFAEDIGRDYILKPNCLISHNYVDPAVIASVTTLASLD